MDTSDPSEPSDVPSRFQVDFTGKRLGAYCVEKRIAEGAMGGVYLAEDTNLGMRVVVKVPHARFLGEPGFRARFRREIAELVRLEHPHVVRILSRGEEEEVPFFVLQYLGGGSLEERLKEKGRQSLPAALSWLRPIADTLDFVHARGVVHRDVKPANILFDEQGHVFLSDFGVVKALGSREDGALTEVGTGVGSPHYMAPEQGLGKDLTGGADQYALATTLYEALAGKPPFAGATVVETILAKQRDPAPGIRALVPDVPPASEAAIRRALDRDPAARFPSCAAFAEEVARPIARIAPGSNRNVVGAIVGLLLLLAFGIGALTGWYGLAKESASSTSEATGKSLVVVAKAGSEPRVARRYRPPQGTVENFAFHGVQTSRLDIPVPLSPRTVRDQRVSVRVERVEKDGRLALAWSLEATRAGKGEDISDAQVESEQKSYDALGDFVGKSTVTARGEVLEAAIEAKKELPADLARQVPAYGDTLRAVEIILPAEPIGLGAVWDVTSVASFIDMRYQQTTTYEVVAVEGDRFRVKFTNTTGAPPQTFHPPGAPEGVSVEIVSFKSSGGGTALLDPARALPVEWAAKQEVEFVFEIPGRSPEAGPRKVTYVGTVESSIVRD